jgi:hypothetical protein
LRARGCSKALSFTLSWSLLFFLFFNFHSTRRHLETTSLLHTNPFKVEKGFKVQFILKVVKYPLPTLTINDYLLLYIQPMPQTYLLYTYLKFTIVKCQGSNPLIVQNCVVCISCLECPIRLKSY